MFFNTIMKEKLFIFEPDYEELIYDTDREVCYYDEIYLSDNGTINLDIPGLKEWLGKYVEEVLIPCETGKTTIDGINKTFDWKTFHEQGIKFAKEVKKLLPENIRLKYSAPFEDHSGIIKDDFFI